MVQPAEAVGLYPLGGFHHIGFQNGILVCYYFSISCIMIVTINEVIK